MLDATDNPREALWMELFSLADEEEARGDGRAKNALNRLRARIERKPPVSRPLHQDNGE